MLTTIRSASLDPTVKRADGDAAAPEARSNRQRRREFVRSNTGGTGAAASSGSQTAGELPPSQIHYWNEYDDGSDGGGGGAANDDGEYAIYIQPGTESSFPVLDHMVAVITAPAHKLGAWLRHHRLLPTDHGQPSSPSQSPVLSTTVGGGSTERSPLLSGGGGGGGGCGPGPATTAGGATYFTLPHPATGGSASGGRTNHKARTATTSDETESVASSGSSPIHPYYPHTSYSNSYYHTAGPSTSGYRTLVAAPASAALLPSVPHQRLALLHRERLLRRVTWAALACSGSLCAVAVVLVTTGRHRQRLEVDAGATIGVVASLCCAAAGLGCMIARRQRTVPTTTIGGELWSGVNGGDLMTGVGMWERLATWTAFVACCIVNGAVLVLVAENS